MLVLESKDFEYMHAVMACIAWTKQYQLPYKGIEFALVQSENSISFGYIKVIFYSWNMLCYAFVQYFCFELNDKDCSKNFLCLTFLFTFRVEAQKPLWSNESYPRY